MTLKTRLEALWMVPLGLGSFLLFRAARAVLAKLIERQSFRQRSYQPGWRPISAATLQMKWYLPWIMTRAPRWNPHALIANAGPFEAKGKLRVRLRDADQGALDWTVVLYSHPHYRTLQVLAPAADGLGPEWQELDVAPGRYTLSLRYYHLQPAPLAPAIEVDGAPFCPSQPLAPDTNAFYRTLAGRSTLFYRALQYYVFVLLRFRHAVSPALLRREFLPVGNPNTQFVYGHHRAGQRIRIALDDALFARCYAYLTIYEGGSFPLAFHDLASARLVSAVAPRAGYYLLRLCARPGQALDGDVEGVSAIAEYPLQSHADGEGEGVFQ